MKLHYERCHVWSISFYIHSFKYEKCHVWAITLYVYTFSMMIHIWNKWLTACDTFHMKFHIMNLPQIFHSFSCMKFQKEILSVFLNEFLCIKMSRLVHCSDRINQATFRCWTFTYYIIQTEIRMFIWWPLDHDSAGLYQCNWTLFTIVSNRSISVIVNNTC